MTDKPIIIGVIGQKGGGGKTTTSLCLAVAAAEQGKTVAIIDLDQQVNSTKWRDRRTTDNVAVAAAPQSRLKHTIDVARSHGADFIVVDCPGHNDSAAVAAVREANLVLLPVEAQMFHLETLPAMRDLIRMGGDKPTWILINKLHPAASIQAEKLKAVLAERYEIPVCPIHWSRLDIYGTSTDVGKTPLEDAPTSKAADEIRSLYQFTIQQVYESTTRQLEHSTM